MAGTLCVTKRFTRSDRDAKKYVGVPFEVPAGTTRFDLALSYPRSDACIIDLGLGDPQLTDFPSEHGLFGWSGSARDRVFVAMNEASPGYLPGVRAGTWTAILGLHRLPERPVDVMLEVRFDRSPRPGPAPSGGLPRPVRPGAGWYRGDLQCHTNHSDARGAPEVLLATARREGLDFLAVTDHNTMTAHATFFGAASSPDLVFLPAYEFTTDDGHGNVFGADRVEDFRAETPEAVLEAVARIRARGGLFSINHDKPNVPWRYPVPEIDCMEVWQAPWLAGNHVSLDRYQARLAEGRRITAVGGSDFHQPASDDTGNLATLARPCTYLMCKELSEDALMDALRRGRSFVTEAPDGPRLVLNVGEVGHGGTVQKGDGLRLRYEVSGAAGDLLEIWDRRGCISVLSIGAPRQAGVVRLDGASGFLRAQIVAAASRSAIVSAAQAHVAAGRGGRMDWASSWDEPVIRALTSPIYLV